MKIDPNQEILNNVHVGRTTRSDRPEKNEFSAMLKKAIKKPSTTIGESEKMEMIKSASNIQMESLSAVQNDPVIERTEKALDILEQYQNKLLDPQSTLRDIHPLVEKMETEKEALVPVLEALPPEDGLRRILTDVLITSSVEVIRFNRGDYVTS